ncbi:MAG TPA: hypothetical protein VES93_02340 [Ornithinibacter sp.]|nr:hypothetical protein [Ornithinibacter sp.]
MSAELPEHSFFPWSRRGIAVRVSEVDHLGDTPAAGPKDRATMTASITIAAVGVPGAPPPASVAVPQEVALVGPGDVKNLAPDVVVIAVPAPGTLNATPGELAYLDFYEEDFPWRYTPARATDDHRLRPWISLLVLADDEYTLTRVPGELSILTVTDAAPLPPPTETWAWAHVQGTGDLTVGPDALEQQVESDPDLARSRLMSPRLLARDTGYHAFVVPTFETGRLAGLRTPPAPGTVPAQQPAWGGDVQPRVFPVLYDWSWRTSPELTDFEVLARRPKAYRIESAGFGTRTLDVSDPGAGVQVREHATVAFEGALAPLDLVRDSFPESPGAGLRGDLLALVDLAPDRRDATGTPIDEGEDPIVTPPAYARRHLGLERVADADTPGTRWLAELNLDPRNRAAAGLGAEIVRRRDEEYLERAWAQVDELEAVNQRLREADLAMAASDLVFAKHIARSGPDRLLGLTAGAQAALRGLGAGDRTIRGEVDASRVPAAAQLPAFRRIARPGRTLVAALTQQASASLQIGLLTRLNEDPATAVSAAPPAPEPVLGVAPTLVFDAAAAMAVQLPRGRDAFAALAGDAVEQHRQAGTLATLTLAALHAAVRVRVDARYPASDPAHTALRAEATTLNDVLVAAGSGSTLTVGAGDDPTVLRIPAATFSEYYGAAIDGKNYLGLVIAPLGSTLSTLAPAASLSNAAEFVTALTDFSALATSRPIPAAAAALTAPATLAAQVAGQVRPMVAMPKRLATVLVGVQDVVAGLSTSRRLQPVLAHPTFADPLFEPLRQLGQDYIVPNIANLPAERIALMKPNVRFIESLLAGVNTEFGRELLWNEYPTDQRGTYFARFFDAADAGAARPPDIPDVPGWDADLGLNAPALAGLLVLVVRAELLVKFPDTLVFAQHGTYSGSGTARRRTLDLAGEVRYPVVRGRLDPDIALYGFTMTEVEAGGGAAGGDDTDAGFFFCFTERPGQVRFGLDLDDDADAPAPQLGGWDDLNWKHLQPVDGEPPAQVLITANAGLQPTTAGLPAWGATSAHMASLLSQNPVWLARHATDMLPPKRG